MADIFISYAREDVATAQGLAEALEAQGWSVFWDRRIPAGRRFDDFISEQLATARCVIVLWSTAAVQSEWVIEEAAEALERNVLAPALIDTVKPPFGFRHRQAADLIDWHQEKIHMGFQRLIKDITSLVSPSAKQMEEKRLRVEVGRESEQKRTGEEANGATTQSFDRSGKSPTDIIHIQVALVQKDKKLRILKMFLGDKVHMTNFEWNAWTINPAAIYVVSIDGKQIPVDVDWLSIAIIGSRRHCITFTIDRETGSCPAKIDFLVNLSPFNKYITSFRLVVGGRTVYED